MMSWDSDVISFGCGNTNTYYYYYRISSETFVEFNIDNLEFMAPMAFPSGVFFITEAIFIMNKETLKEN